MKPFCRDQGHRTPNCIRLLILKNINNKSTNKKTNKNAGFKVNLYYESVKCCYSEDCDTVTTSPTGQIFAEEFGEYVQIIQSQLYSKNGLGSWASRRSTNATIESHD